jgi:arabinan endo-1,5-alpha-L-arabinosidase
MNNEKIMATPVYKKSLIYYWMFIPLIITINIRAQQSASISVHDPVMIQEDGIYYLFCTGWGINVWSSTNMRNWKKELPVFEKVPFWTTKTVKDFEGHIWAPDISFFNNKYYLFYSVSSFGKNTSCIGLATNQTLDSNSPCFKWVDQGKIIQSIPGVTNWNAIDPNLAIDNDETPYLVFGSFWDGIKLIKLTKDGTAPAEDISKIPTIASRKKSSSFPNPPAIDNNPKDAGGNAIEAPFIFKKNSYYYLFASIDYCCKGKQSTYKMIIGRSKQITGPYLDKKGKNMATGGGSVLLKGDKNWYGVGHCGTYTFNGSDYLIFHGYDAHDEGIPKLIIKNINWDKNKWPEL